MDEKLRQIVAETLKIDAVEVVPELGQSTSDKWDSLAQVVMISRITDEMGVAIPLEKMMEVECVQDLMDIVGV